MNFHLLRYFTLTSLAAFVLVTVILTMFYREAAIHDLLTLQESKNVALTKTFANSLWGDFKDFVESSKGKSGDELRRDPSTARLRKAVLDLMKGLTVAKVKVFNLDGLTVFSTEAKQIGADKSGNSGFISAKSGVPASELTHRDTFSAFEKVIEDRDVISSYIPIYNNRTEKLEGVFEVYDDVTPFLVQINKTQWVIASGVTIVLGLLYLALLLIVRRADNTIKEQERQRIEAESQMHHSEKMASLGQMVAGVMHEINTPLGYARSNIEMSLELLSSVASGRQTPKHVSPAEKNTDGIQEVEETRELLGYSLKGLDQMSELVVNLKDFARIDRAKIAKTSINDMIDNVLRITNHLLKGRIEVDKQYGQLPEIECMPSQLNQVFFNLIANASQAIKDKGRIWIRTVRQGNKACIEIWDNGSGIPPEIIQRIFEPFYTSKGSQEGTGLGLSIARKIVLQHGGDIRVRSKEGAGTQFIVVLPVRQSSKLAEAA